jgi:hypothetical protein
MLKTCVACKVPKERINKHPDKRGKASYVDAKGGHWRGNKCAECYSEERKAVALREGGELLDPITTRKCTKCAQLLPASRFYTHKECASLVEDSFDHPDMIYV